MICDELPDEYNLVTADALATVDHYGSSVTERVSERKLKMIALLLSFLYWI